MVYLKAMVSQVILFTSFLVLAQLTNEEYTGCGSIVDNTLTSPGYPNDYPDDLDCVYHVPIPNGTVLSIYFTDFDVEEESFCSYDYLKIANERNQTIGVYCGQRSRERVYVTGQYAVISFHTDGSVQERGYQLFFSHVPVGNTTVPPVTTQWPYTTSPSYTGCGSVVNNTLTSPGYPSDYPNNMDCVYRVQLQHDMALRIYFNYFQLEYDSSCGYDYVRISTDDQTIGTYCGQQSGHSILVTGHYAEITFHSDGSVQHRGYELFFSHVPFGCSTTLNETYGELQFNLSSSYFAHIRCNWVIQNAGVNHAVALVSVQELNLKYCSEYANITDGNGSSVFYHQGCVPFAPENLLDVEFGHSGNITVQTYFESAESDIKVKFAILKRDLTSAIVVSGWNVTVLNPASTSFTLQWSKLRTNINRIAKFYVVLLKSTEGTLLGVEIVSGTTTTLDIKRLKPSTEYRVGVYGVDDIGQPYKSVGSFTSTTKVFCGFRPSGSRIVGGSVARVNSWPWQAMLIHSYGSQFCGGSLVHPYWVVTAAHCVAGKTPSDVKIKLGAHYLTSGSVGTEQEVEVAKIISHEQYDSISNSHDITLIQLEKPAKLGVGVGLVCMPDMRYPLPFDNIQRKCWITGWGTLSSGGIQPNSLMEAQVPLVSKQRCESAYPGEIDDTMLCAGLDAGGVDTCQGDSGGPLVCEFNGTWYLEGITSWGNGCAYARKYGIYAYVRNLKSWVSKKMYDFSLPTPSPQKPPVSSLAWCNFDNGLCSGWNQSSSDDFDWTLASGSTPSSATGPSSGQGGSGKYMYIEASSPRKPAEKAKLAVTVPNTRQKTCLSFYYHVYGAAVGSLIVYSGSSKVFNVSGNQGNKWIMVERSFYLDGSVTFEGIVGNSYTGDIAIDSVKITDGNCPVSCNFDDGLCLGWTQSQSDDFDWTLQSGPTPSSPTGPSSDHGGSGKYLYIEATDWSAGENAKLQFAVPRNKSSCCLVFYYHMYGSAMGTLNVFSGNNKIFTRSGNQGNYWKKVTRTLYFSDILTFEGIRGSSYTSDIAIDDVSVTDGNCPDCGGFVNQSSGELFKGNHGEEDDSQCKLTIGDAGIKEAVAIITLKMIYLSYCSEHFRIHKDDGTEVYSQEGCRSSLPYGSALEIPFGATKHLLIEFSLEYKWSAVNISFNILNQGLNSAENVSSWEVTIGGVNSSSAKVSWTAFPVSLPVNYFLVRYREVATSVSTLYQVSHFSNTYCANLLKGFTAYGVQVFAVTENNGTYASKVLSLQTEEGVPSRAPSNVRVLNHGLNDFLVKWNPLPQQYANGRLLRYNIYYKISTYYYYSERIVNTSNPVTTQVILPNIQTGTRYQISVAALTSKGQGPRSPLLYVTKSCGGFVNQSFGWLNFTHTDYDILNCSVSIHNAGLSQGVALISFQYTNLQYCSEAVEIYNGDGAVVFSRRGCDSFPRGLAVEIPFADRPSLTLEVLLSSRYSYTRIQYTVLDKLLSAAQVVPSWNVTITNITSFSLAVKWTNFPLSISVQRFLVKYAELNSNFSLVFQSSTWYNTHHTGNVLKGFRLYEVTVIAVATGFGNETYSSVPTLTRTSEGVPRTAPSNVRVSNIQLGNLKVEWDPIPQQTANGRLLGYRVYFYEYHGYSWIQTADTSNANVHMLVLRGLKAAQMYVISVAAFTSKGAGPRSPSVYFTTGCRGHLNQTFGQLHIGADRGYSDSSCNFVIGRAGIIQAVAIVWVQDMILDYYGEYIKITDGNGSLVLYNYAYSSSALKSFLEVDFGQSNNITIEIYLRAGSYSRFKLQYGISKHGIQSALPMANWSGSIVNTTTTSITISWKNFTSVLAQHILHYVVVMKNTNGSILNVNIVSRGTTSAAFNGLSPYAEYRVTIVGVDDQGNSYKSSDVTVWTDEGVPSRAPSYITFTDVKATRITVHWSPLPQQYHNGRLLGYKVYFQRSAYYSYPLQSNGSSLIVSNPNTTLVTLTGLRPGQRYDISVSAFTSKGEGPPSYRFYVTTDCEVNVNQSFGLIDVTQTDYNSLYCYWTIGNIGITRPVALFIIQKINFGYCSEYFKIFNGRGALEYHQSGCSPSSRGSLVEVPFLTSNNITTVIYLTGLKSSAKVQYVILGRGLNSASLLPGWTVTVENTTFASIFIQWKNLTSHLGRHIREYIVLLNRNNDSALAHKVTHGDQLNMEISGLVHSTNYTVEVFGVDERGQPYRTLAVNTRTKNISCGSRPSSARIVGGTVAPVNGWPWQAMLRDSSGRQFCGGSLIDPQWVLTATHCIYGKSTSSVKVRLGAHYRLSASVGTEQDFDVVKIIHHERYNTPNSWSNDVALLKLSRPAKIGKGVGLVCLSDDNFQRPFDDSNKTCWITGWGRLYYYGYFSAGPQPNELMQVDVPLVSKQRCMDFWPGKIDDSMICIGRDQGGQGACKGDSGGPLVCEFSGKWYLEGVTSWVSIPCADALKPSVYASVRYLKSWIINKISHSPSGPAQASCNFDSGLCYGWQQSDTDVFNWTRHTGSTPSLETGPSSDHTSGFGYYMYIEASSPRQEGDNAKLELSVSGSGALACLEFYYSMYGAGMGSLSVFSGNAVVFNVSGNQGYLWKKAIRTIYLNRAVTFEGTVGSSYTGDIAIDDVSISSGSCPAPSLLTCNFDFGLCSGWRQSFLDVFDWTHNRGPTASSGTGPSADHTSGSGYYMYIEASSPRQTGDYAVLELSLSGSGEIACLKFYYHMYGGSIGTLTVFSGNKVVFNASGNHGDYWREAIKTVYLQNTITFTGVVGSSYTGDIAIDDVTITGGRCLKSTASPTPQTSSTVVSSWSSSQPTDTATSPRPSSVVTYVSPSSRPHAGTSQPGTYKPTIKTLSAEQKQESVMLKVRGLDIKKWDTKKEHTFKREIARAATDYCSADGAQCQLSSTSSRRRRSSGMKFSTNMVHILQGYPKHSPEDLPVVLLAFYLSLPKALANSNIVKKGVLIDIVKNHMPSIEGSLGGTIMSVEPLPFTTENLGDTNEGNNSSNESKPTSIIIGTLAGGVLLFVIIAALLLGWKRRNRFARKQRLVNEDTVPKSAPQMSTGKNVDHIGSVEQTIELEEKGAPCTPGEPPKQEFCENATGTKQSEPCSANSVQFSAVCNQQKCAESQVCQETKAQYRLTTVM